MTIEESPKMSRDGAIRSIITTAAYSGVHTNDAPKVAFALLEVADAIREVADTQDRFADIMQKPRAIAKEAPRRVVVPDGDSFADVDPRAVAAVNDWASEGVYPTRIILHSGKELFLKSSIADVRAALAAAEEQGT